MATIARMMGNSVEVILRSYYMNREDIDFMRTNYDAALLGLYQKPEAGSYKIKW